jgi:hypothetical protein
MPRPMPSLKSSRRTKSKPAATFRVAGVPLIRRNSSTQSQPNMGIASAICTLAFLSSRPALAGQRLGEVSGERTIAQRTSEIQRLAIGR